MAIQLRRANNATSEQCWSKLVSPFQYDRPITVAPALITNNCYSSTRRVSTFISVGANVNGTFGAPLATCVYALRLMKLQDVNCVQASSMYETLPIGTFGRQPSFLNAVVTVNSSLPPAELLRRLKIIERAAGRKNRRRNEPRPLDLDIIDYSGRVIGWSATGARTGDAGTGMVKPVRRARLTLPHPEMHKRLFVLAPLMELAPHWYHPVLKASVRQLLHRSPHHPHAIQRRLEPSWISCDF